ncbi:MAG TPA: hypothetical protein VLD36_19825 [Burkholderiales bacterium]|nr:hypothetical protein [Burkholderiales bacterium]
MLGRAAVAMWWDVPQEVRAEWEDWHSHEHMPERLGVPGFLRGSRWVALSGEPSYFVLYEVARLATITSGPYLERLNNPTPWSRKMMPHHRNMVRSLCRVRASFGGGLGQAVATIRFSPPPRGGRALVKRLASEVLPGLPGRRGLSGAHLLESQPTASTPQTTEQRIRGGDAPADRALLVCGYDVDAVRAVARDELALPGAVEGLYRLAYAMTCKDLPG